MSTVFFICQRLEVLGSNGLGGTRVRMALAFRAPCQIPYGYQASLTLNLFLLRLFCRKFLKSPQNVPLNEVMYYSNFQEVKQVDLYNCLQLMQHMYSYLSLASSVTANC